MIRISKSVLMMGVAVVALAACSSNKGPGAIGTKDDIVVRNNGLPGSQPPLPGGDVTDPAVAALNDPLAIPPPAVEQGQPLPDTSPEMEAAVQAEQEQRAPVASSVSEPMNDPAQPLPPTASEAAIPEEPVTSTATTTPPAYMPEPIEQAAPQAAPVAMPEPAPVAQQTTPAVAPVAAPSSVYPAEHYPAQPEIAAPAQAPVQAISPRPEAAPSANAYVPMPAGSNYPLDPNAPYSPSAMAGRTSASTQTSVAPPVAAPVAAPTMAPATAPAAAAPAPTTSSLNLADPVLIRSAQTALKAKGAYAGPENGTIDTTFLNALTAYQVQNKLPVGGLNMETLRNLAVIE